MPTRRAHHKSRNGCLTCKQRRVKCDEAGPPCGACAIRMTECRYGAMPLTTTIAIRRAPDELIQSGAEDGQGSVNGIGYDRRRDPDRHRPTPKIELELMHRWTTETYKSLCRNTESDRYACQVMIPQAGFRHDFLLNSVFALAALDIASSGPAGPVLASSPTPSSSSIESTSTSASSSAEIAVAPPSLIAARVSPDPALSAAAAARYVRIGWQYEERALTDLRAALAINPPTAPIDELAFGCSLLMVLSLISTRFPVPGDHGDDTRLGLMESIQAAVQHTKGAIALVNTQPSIRETSPLFKGYPIYSELPVLPLNPEDEALLRNLETWNDSREPSRDKGEEGSMEEDGSLSGSSAGSSSSVMQTMSASALTANSSATTASPATIKACKRALLCLRGMLERCSVGDARGYMLDWPRVSGEDFMDALKAGDCIAMLAMAHWGILFDKIGCDFWWTQGIGTAMLDEVTKSLLLVETDETKSGSSGSSSSTSGANTKNNINGDRNSTTTTRGDPRVAATVQVLWEELRRHAAPHTNCPAKDE